MKHNLKPIVKLGVMFCPGALSISAFIADILKLMGLKLNRTTAKAYEPKTVLQINANFTNATDMDEDSVNI